MHRPRRLKYEGLAAVPGAELEHVSHYFDEPHPYVGQRLLIVGGRNSAVEAAIRCHRAGAHVALSYRRPQLDPSIKYWLKPEIDWLIRTGAIDFHPGTVPVEIRPAAVWLAPVDAALQPDLNRSCWQETAADFVLLLIGYEMDSDTARDGRRHAARSDTSSRYSIRRRWKPTCQDCTSPARPPAVLS